MIRIAQRELSLPETVFFIIMVLFCVVMERKKSKRAFPWRLSISILLVFYITILRRTKEDCSIRLVPFEKIKLRTLYANFLNVVLFVPFGFELKRKFSKLSKKMIIFVGAVFSLMIESLQLLLSRGIFETEDIICNTLGTLTGSVFFVIFYYTSHRRKL